MMKELFTVVCLVAVLQGCGDSEETPPTDVPLTCSDIDPTANCGECGDGVWECVGGEPECRLASATNACGSCGPLGGVPGDLCGTCGTLECGEAGSLVCTDDHDTNACGGCEETELTPGFSCDSVEDGVIRCTGPNETQCLPLGANGCGGAEPLSSVPGSACGTCGRGAWVCDGTDALTCQGESNGVNACGGCFPLEGEPGASCGGCSGEWTCAGPDRVVCDELPRNECGGCAALGGTVGSECDGGLAFCAGPDTLGCGAGTNACGGNAELDPPVADSCGACEDGILLCAGPDATQCLGASAANACGGCGFLPGNVGERCAPNGAWACEGTELVCELTADGNACGGNTELSETLGAACGVCERGTIVCDGFEATTCSVPVGIEVEAWPDTDGDGFGDGNADPATQCELETGFVRNADDCDDGSELVHPDAAELCNERDDDCDDATDESAVDATVYFRDADADGFGSSTTTRACGDAPSGFSEVDGDCDDSDAAYNPDAPEDDCADPADYNCDGETAYVDADGDGYAACIDCDDDPTRNPGVTERCNDIDDNCNGEIDEGPALGSEVLYPDVDNDGFGVEEGAILRCEVEEGYALLAGDCEPDLPLVYPGQPEVCDGLDNDCDGRLDPTDSVDALTWFWDGDSDGFGRDGVSIVSCGPEPGYSLAGGDCDDRFADIRPATAESPVTELCDFIDNDCDGFEDEADDEAPGVWFRDRDADGFGDDLITEAGCVELVDEARPPGTASVGGDCNDVIRAVNPDAEELAGDEYDQNCDGDELCLIDEDGDGAPPSLSATILSVDDLTCTSEDGEAPAGSFLLDCDDADPLRHPLAAEVPGDDIDQNCDGAELCFRDRDGDSYRPLPDDEYPGGDLVLVGDTECRFPGSVGAWSPQTDCNDYDPFMRPGNVDSALDPRDNNCDGLRGDIETARFVSAARGVDTLDCGSLESPCASVAGAFLAPVAAGCGTWSRQPCDILVEQGEYGPFDSQEHYSAMVGGYPIGFFGEHTGDRSTTVFRGDEFTGTQLLFVRGSLMTLTVHAPVEPTFGARSVGLYGLVLERDEFLLRDVAIVGEKARDMTGDVGLGQTSVALMLEGTGTVVIEDSEIRIGAGGDAPGPGLTEGGAAIGVLADSTIRLSIDGETEVTIPEGSGGGSTQPGVGWVDNEGSVLGAEGRPWRTGLRGMTYQYYSPPAASGVGRPDYIQDVFERVEADGRATLYNRIDDGAVSLEERRESCNYWGGDLATIEDADEEAFLADYLARLALAGGSGEVMVGYFAPVPPLPYEWDAALSDYTNWGTDEPGSPAQSSCVRMFEGGTSGRATSWELAECRSRGAAFLCEDDRGDFCVPGGGSCTEDRECVATAADPSIGVCLSPNPDRNPALFMAALDEDVSGYEILWAGSRDGGAIACEEWGGHLAEISSEAELNLVESLLVATPETQVWLSYSALGGTDEFSWHSGATEVAFVPPWDTDEPSREGLGNGAMLRFSAATTGTVDDAEASLVRWEAGTVGNPELPYLCERRMRESP